MKEIDLSLLPEPVRRAIEQIVWWSTTRHTFYDTKNCDDLEIRARFAKHNNSIRDIHTKEEIEATQEAMEHQLRWQEFSGEVFELFTYEVSMMHNPEMDENMMPERYHELKKKYPKAYANIALACWG